MNRPGNINDNAKNILEDYEILTPLDAREQVFLVLHKVTKEILVEKIIQIYNLGLYERLQKEPVKGIPRIHDLLEMNGKLIITEDYIHGRNLEKILKEQGCFSEEQTIAYMIELCEILNRLHEKDPPIIHRDVKAANIILSYEGNVRLIDFNISREYHPGARMDTQKLITPHFSAPELYGFGQSDHRSDIYSVGATMHYLLTGGYLKETFYDGPLREIINRCTQIDAKNRYQSVKELKRELIQCYAKNYCKRYY